MSERTRRVGQLLKAEIADLLLRGLKEDLPAFTTITTVTVTPDLRVANVGFSVFGTDDEADRTQEILTEAAPRMRHEIGRRIRLKFTPELRFELDKGMEHADRLEDLFEEIRERDETAPAD